MKLQVIFLKFDWRKTTQSTRRPERRCVLHFIFKKLHLFTCYIFAFSFFLFHLQVRNKIPKRSLCRVHLANMSRTSILAERYFALWMSVGTNLLRWSSSPQRTSGHTALTIEWLNDAVEWATLDRELLFAAALPSSRKHWHVPITQKSNQTVCH